MYWISLHQGNAVITKIQSNTNQLPSNTLLIIFLEGTSDSEKQTIRNCISSSFNYSLVGYSKCKSDANAELLVFNNTVVFPPTNGKNNDDDDDGLPPTMDLPTLNSVILNCGGHQIIAYSTVWGCGDLSPFSGI